MSNEDLTLEKLPVAVQLLREQMNRLQQSIDELLSNKDSAHHQATPPRLDIDQLREFLPFHPTRAAIYGLTHRKKLPFHRAGKHLVFYTAEIEAWMPLADELISAEFTTKPTQGKKKKIVDINGADNNLNKSEGSAL